jgi:hypothetical protein
VTTDDNGEFTGSFVTLTGWVFAVRPPPPKLSEVYLCVHRPVSAQEVRLRLTPEAQAAVVSGARQLDLGTVILASTKNP